MQRLGLADHRGPSAQRGARLGVGGLRGQDLRVSGWPAAVSTHPVGDGGGQEHRGCER
jgi:hypothetical protein